MRSPFPRLFLVLSLLSVCPPALGAQTFPPLDFVQGALARHRLVFLGDIHPLAEPKQLVARLVREQGPGATIDLLALEVASEQQEAIDRYLGSVPEDTTILLDNPRTLRSHWGVSAEYLDIYRSVYRWNANHPEHQVRVLAADIRGWPISPLTEHMATGGFVNRDVWMAAAFRKVLEQHRDWRRILAFMGGYHGLKTVGGQVTLGRVHDRFDRWFAGYLTDEGYEVYTVLTDALQDGGHGATRVYDQLAAGRSDNFAVALDTTSDAVREPLWDVDQEGYKLEFWPSRFPLRMAADAMIVLTRARPITLLR
jgi:hypothetical protein